MTRMPRRRLPALLALALFIGAIALAAHGIGSLTGAPASTIAPQAATGEQPWHLVLVNSTHPLPEDFSIQTAEMPGGEAVDARIADHLTQMLDACAAAGYRIKEYEAEGLSPERARDAALDWVALPGTSEHELGLAVDINDENGDAGMYDWLAEHAHEYGFIQRYPPEKSSITGISHEPWHYRYVGEEAATAIYEKGIALEEYLA